MIRNWATEDHGEVYDEIEKNLREPQSFSVYLWANQQGQLYCIKRSTQFLIPNSKSLIKGLYMKTLNFHYKILCMLSMKTQYAFQALMYMAQKPRNEPVLIAEISEQKLIPIKFLENILLQLKKSGLLESKKGKGGGYYFAQQPSSIKLSVVMRLLDGPIALLPCVSLNFYSKCKGCEETHCGLNKVMKNVRDASLSILETCTVADIAGGS